MSKKLLICITKFPFIEVEKYGKFKKGDIKEFPDRIARHLLFTHEFEIKRESPIIKKEIITKPNQINKKRRTSWE